MSAAGAPLFPPLKWAQRQDLVLITVELQDGRDVKLQLPKNGAALAFACDVPGTESGGATDGVKHYACELDLYQSVSPEESHFVVRPRQIEVRLKKKTSADGEDDAFWPRLTRDKSKNKNITIDWARWKDEDDEAGDEMDMGDFGFGGGGMMGGPDDDDDEMTQKMLQQFAVSQGKIGAEQSEGEAIAPFGSAAGQEAGQVDVNEADDDDLPPLEEDD